jgi:hypothetical protein
MKRTHVFTEKASADVLKAALWEEARHEGLGGKLLNCIDEAVEQICNAPYAYASKYRNTREKKINKFSYQIIYTVENKIIYIHAFFACKADPQKKYKNL